MSRNLDTACYRALETGEAPPGIARLKAVSASKAGAWLQATPSKGLGNKLSHALFRTGVQLWPGSRQAGADAWRCMRDQIMDSRGFHCLTCMAGGDATVLHNALRDYIYAKACCDGLNPQREQQHVLPGAPSRRPGDITIAQWPGGAGAALDFAVTFPLQADIVDFAAQEQLAAALIYEERERQDRNTQEQCRERGLLFIRMVVECFGG